MAQNITLEIAGKSYPLQAQSPEAEEAMRKSAARINERYAALARQFPLRSIDELMAMVALNEAVNSFVKDRKFAAAQSEAAQLESQLEAYLQGK